jgi:hypothetical protein
MNFEDDFFHGGAGFPTGGAGAPYHHPHLPPYQQQQHESIWKTIYRLSAVAGHEKRIGVAILVICLYQFRGTFLRGNFLG